MKTPVIETPRLILRPLTLEDAPRTQALFPHWEIVRYLADIVPWPFPHNGAETFYRHIALPAVERHEEWIWTLRLKQAPHEHIGSISLCRGDHENRGFWLGLPWQGQGLVTEAVVAANDFWFHTLGFKNLATSKAAANLASRRVSEKTGMRLINTFQKGFVSGVLPAERWELTAEQWRQQPR